MKTFVFLFIFSLIISIHTYSQHIASVQEKLVHDLTKSIVCNSWQLTESPNQIHLIYIDTFFINTSISPLYNYNGSLNKADTLYINIRLEESWTKYKYDSIRNEQQQILDPLIEKFIAHYDSLQWRFIKSNKEMFLYDYYRYLTYWNGFTKKEKDQLKNLVRLPEKIIQDVGLFTDSSLKCYAMIQPIDVNRKVSIAYEEFSEILGETTLYRCADIYK